MKKRLYRAASIFLVLALLLAFAPVPSAKAAIATQSYTMEVGDIRALEANTAGYSGIIAGSFIWTSHDPAVSINYTNGTKTARIEANSVTSTYAYVECRFNYYSGATVGTGIAGFRIAVNPARPKSVTIAPTATVIRVGEGLQFNYAISPAYATADTSVKWYSSNESAATVTSTGYVRAVGSGEANITVITANNKSAWAHVVCGYPPLTVQSVEPPANSYIPSDTSIVLRYNQTLKRGSDFASISLRDITANSTVAAAASVSGEALTVTPSTRLTPSHRYLLTIPTNAVTNTGNIGANDTLSYSFTVEPLSIVSSAPVNGAAQVPVDSAVTVTFDSAVSQGSEWASISLSTLHGGAAAITKSISGATLTVTPAEPLLPYSYYALTIPAGALLNSFGAANRATLDISFTTEMGDMTVISSTPAQGSTSARVGGDIVLRFPNELTATGLLSGICLRDLSWNVPIAGSVTASGSSVYFTPDVALDYGVDYELTLPAGAVRNSENRTNSPYTLAFTTGALESSSLTPPVFTPAGGGIGSPVTITADQSSVIYYSTDGSNPALCGTRYSSPITLTAPAQLRAVAVRSGVVSEVSTASFTEPSMSAPVRIATGSSGTDRFNAVAPAADGGWFAAGTVSSNNGDWAGSASYANASLVKFSCNGTVEWRRLIGCSGTNSLNEEFSGILPMPDGGCIVGGTLVSSSDSTLSDFGSDLYSNRLSEIMLLRYDASGNVVWKKLFGSGGAYNDTLTAMADVGDGFVVAGWADSNGINGTGSWSDCSSPSGRANSQDAILLKYDYSGNIVWKKFFGGNSTDKFYGVTATSDGGCLAVGASFITGFGTGDLSALTKKGSYNDDAILVKYSANGTVQWTKNFGGSDEDCLYDVIEADGGYIAVGYTRSDGNSADFVSVPKRGYHDGVIAKFDLSGSLVWTRRFGGGTGESENIFNAVVRTDDCYLAVGSGGRSGYLIDSGTGFGSGDWAGTSGRGGLDAISVRWSFDGTLLGATREGTGGNDKFNDVALTDSGWVVAGEVTSYSAYPYDWDGYNLQGTDASFVRFARDVSVVYCAGGIAAQSAPIGSTVTLSSQKPNNPGFTFRGWSADPTASSAAYLVGDTLTLDSDVFLYPVWSPHIAPVVTSMRTLCIVGRSTVAGEATYTAVPFPSDMPLGSVTWSNSNTSVAAISSDGVLTPKKNGSVVITATSSLGISGSYSVKVVGTKSTPPEPIIIGGSLARPFDPDESSIDVLIDPGVNQVRFGARFTTGTLSILGSLLSSGSTTILTANSYPQSFTATYSVSGCDDRVYTITLHPAPVLTHENGLLRLSSECPLNGVIIAANYSANERMISVTLYDVENVASASYVLDRRGAAKTRVFLVTDLHTMHPSALRLLI